MIIFTASDSSEGEEESLDPSKDTAPLIKSQHTVCLPGTEEDWEDVMKVSLPRVPPSCGVRDRGLSSTGPLGGDCGPPPSGPGYQLSSC